MSFLSAKSFSLNSHPFINLSKSQHHNSLPNHGKPHSISFSKTPAFQITAILPKFPSISPNLITTHEKVSNFLTKNAVKLLLGSVILVGSFNVRPVLANTPLEKNGVNLEEKEEMENEEESVVVEEEEGDEEMMYVRLLEQEPRNVELLKVMVNLKMRKGKTKDAVKYVEMLSDIEPEEVEWRLLQGLCYEMMGQFSKAKRLFKDLLKENPLLLRALHGLAMVMHKNHEGPAVFEMLNQAVEYAHRERRVAEERNIKILIAQLHLVKGELDEASKRYQQLIAENPRDFRPYLCQGIIYTLQDKKTEADEQFEIYRNLVPEEFPQRGFLEDVVLAAKTESREQLEKEFKTQVSYKK